MGCCAALMYKLLGNADRHLKNIGVLYNSARRHVLRRTHDTEAQRPAAIFNLHPATGFLQCTGPAITFNTTLTI